jgi:tripartite-type tricarboxylate transporter receptor subunit TctC
MLRRSVLKAAAGLAALPTMASTIAWAEAPWPNRRIRCLVGFAPGGTADILARKLQQPLSERLGQPIIIENRTGASGINAAIELARTGADGYNFGLVVSTHAALPAISKKLPYDTERDFAPVVFIGSIPLVLVVAKNSPFNTLADLLAAAKAKPGSINYAIPGIGLSHHFAGELLKQRAGVNITAIAYRGTAPSLTDVIAGTVEMTFGTLPSTMGGISAGIIRPLAITSPKRSESLPQVPTVEEFGYPDFDVSEWYGLMAAAGTAPDIVKRLNEETNAALASADLQVWLKENNVVRGTTTPEGFRKFISGEIEKLTVIAKNANISID